MKHLLAFLAVFDVTAVLLTLVGSLGQGDPWTFYVPVGSPWTGLTARQDSRCKAEVSPVDRGD